MAFKLKGSSFYGSPFKQNKPVPKPKKSKTSAHGQLDDAAAEYETDKKLYAEYLKKKNSERNKIHNEDQKQEIKEDKKGVGDGHNKKVMKDGYINPTQKKKIADEKARFNALTPEQKKAEQDAANDKADKFHKRGKYAVKKKPSQGDFTPAYPGADISKEEYDKRRKAGSTKRD